MSLLAQIKAGAAILGLIFFCASYYVVYSRGYEAGKSAVESKIAKQIIDQSEKTAKESADARKKLDQDTDKIILSRDDGPLAGVLRDQLIRMRDNIH